MSRHRFLFPFLVAGLTIAGISDASGFCVDQLGGYAIFQCGDVAFLEPVPDPSFALTHDPNFPWRVTNIHTVFWQIGFGNEAENTGLGTDGTGMQSLTLFRGNDQGQFTPEIFEGGVFSPGQGFPPGAVCLANNNWETKKSTVASIIPGIQRWLSRMMTS